MIIICNIPQMFCIKCGNTNPLICRIGFVVTFRHVVKTICNANISWLQFSQVACRRDFTIGEVTVKFSRWI